MPDKWDYPVGMPHGNPNRRLQIASRSRHVVDSEFAKVPRNPHTLASPRRNGKNHPERPRKLPPPLRGRSARR